MDLDLMFVGLKLVLRLGSKKAFILPHEPFDLNSIEILHLSCPRLMCRVYARFAILFHYRDIPRLQA
jgi:hypothetical protein